MERAGLLPPPPPELHGVRLGTEYISILAQAQKMVGVATHDRLMNSVLPTMQIFPDMRHKIDPFALVDTYAEMLGVDPRIIATDVAQRSLAQERRVQAAQVATEQAATAAKAAKDASQTPMTGDTALARVMSSGAGAATGRDAAGGVTCRAINPAQRQSRGDRRGLTGDAGAQPGRARPAGPRGPPGHRRRRRDRRPAHGLRARHGERVGYAGRDAPAGHVTNLAGGSRGEGRHHRPAPDECADADRARGHASPGRE